MKEPLVFEAVVLPEWLDYNGHMRDASYGLVFSLALDVLQDAVGIDAGYRARTGCTIYSLEDRKRYRMEARESDPLSVSIHLLDVSAKVFRHSMVMTRSEDLICFGSFLMVHVQQNPQPRATPFPPAVFAALEAQRLDESSMEELCTRLGLSGPGWLLI